MARRLFITSNNILRIVSRRQILHRIAIIYYTHVADIPYSIYTAMVKCGTANLQQCKAIVAVEGILLAYYLPLCCSHNNNQKYYCQSTPKLRNGLR